MKNPKEIKRFCICVKKKITFTKSNCIMYSLIEEKIELNFKFNSLNQELSRHFFF